MRRVLFLTSHLCSGSEVLFESLCTHSKIEGYRTNFVYSSFLDLLRLTEFSHKENNSSSIYMDELLFNHSISSKIIYEMAYYIFYLRNPRDTINEIVSCLGYTYASAVSYYILRLKRLSYIAKKSKCVLFTPESSLICLEKLLGLKKEIILAPVLQKKTEDLIPQKFLIECEAQFKKTCKIINHYSLNQ